VIGVGNVCETYAFRIAEGNYVDVVHAALKKLPEIVSFRLADESAGSWGATLVSLKPPPHVVPKL